MNGYSNENFKIRRKNIMKNLTIKEKKRLKKYEEKGINFNILTREAREALYLLPNKYLTDDFVSLTVYTYEGYDEIEYEAIFFQPKNNDYFKNCIMSFYFNVIDKKWLPVHEEWGIELANELADSDLKLYLKKLGLFF